MSVITKENIDGLITTIQNLYLSDDIPWIFGWKRQYCDRPTRVDGNRKTSCRNAEKADPYYEHGHACGISNCLTVGEKVFGADEGGWERKGHAFCS